LKDKEKDKDKANRAAEDEAEASDVSYMTTNAHPRSKYSWLKDSGCNIHICNDKSAFVKLKPHRSTIRGIQNNVELSE
jgi:hypothetical protein